MWSVDDVPAWVLADDGPLLALNKPAGLMTQGAPRPAPSLEALVKDYLKQRFAKPGNVYLGIPHRLDRPVSGVIVFARNSKAAARLAEQFRDRSVRKTYLAVTESCPTEPAGELHDWLLKRADVAHVDVVPPGTPGAQLATLRYRVVSQRAARALVEIELLTGRMHQIRVQFGARGWPIVGDLQYGAASTWIGRPTSVARQLAGAEPMPSAPSRPGTIEPPAQLALHAASLELQHPVRYDRLVLRAPLPATWDEFEWGSIELTSAAEVAAPARDRLDDETA